VHIRLEPRRRFSEWLPKGYYLTQPADRIAAPVEKMEERVSSTPSAPGGRPKGRLEAFSDGVFAIAITLLVIEIAVPKNAGDHLLSALLHERAVYVTYFLAFMTIGIAWVEHSALTEALDRVDSGFQRLNLLLLLLVAFVPFPARVMEEYLALASKEGGGERTAVMFFGIILFLISLVLILLGRYAAREGLFGADAAEGREEENRVKYQLGPSLVFYAVAALCGLIQPYVAVVLYILVGVYLLLPVDLLRRWLGKADG
jgi:uncharacterized membrane protein